MQVSKTGNPSCSSCVSPVCLRRAERGHNFCTSSKRVAAERACNHQDAPAGPSTPTASTASRSNLCELSGSGSDRVDAYATKRFSSRLTCPIGLQPLTFDSHRSTVHLPSEELETRSRAPESSAASKNAKDSASTSGISSPSTVIDVIIRRLYRMHLYLQSQFASTPAEMPVRLSADEHSSVEVERHD